jgi:amidase
LPDIDWEALHELFGELLGAVTGAFDPSAELRDEQRSLAWYLAALDRRDRFAAVWHAFFADVDALVLPAAMTTAFTHDDSGGPVDVDGVPAPYGGQGHVLVFCNLAGIPALVVPAGLDDAGLPVGVQIVGPRWSEPRLLAVARELERAGVLPGFQAPPLASA